MPRNVTMLKLESRCRRRADLENEEHIDTEEWRELISEAWGELHGIVADAGLRYWETATTLSSDGTNELAEPADIRSLIGIWYVESSGKRYQLRPALPQERGVLSGSTGSRAKRYEFRDDTFFLYPTPPTGQSYELLYVPQATDLSEYADDDLVDCVTAEGEAYVIWATLVKAKSKSESDVRLAVGERDRLAKIVEQWAINRMMIEPHRRIVSDADFPEGDDGEW